MDKAVLAQEAERGGMPKTVLLHHLQRLGHVPKLRSLTTMPKFLGLLLWMRLHGLQLQQSVGDLQPVESVQFLWFVQLLWQPYLL